MTPLTPAGQRAEYELCHFDRCAGMKGPNDCDCGVASAIAAIERQAADRALALVYAQGWNRPAPLAVANVCDETLDRSGAMLGRVRKQAALIDEASTEAPR